MSAPELYNSKVISTYLKLLRSKYSYVNISELLEYAGMESYQVEDGAHWFTQEQINRFFERVQQVTGNDNIAREAGRYSISLDAIGALPQYLLGWKNPLDAFLLVSKIAPNFARSATYEAKKISANKVEITVTPKPGIREQSFQCDNRIGYFEAVGLSIAHHIPEIEHRECIFRGAEACIYEITWRDTMAGWWKKAGRSVSLIMLVLSIVLFIVGSPIFAVVGLSISVITLLAVGAYVSMLEQDELKNAVSQLRSSAEDLVRRTNTNYNHALLINEIGHALSKRPEGSRIFETIVEIMGKRTDYDRGVILLANEGKSELYFAACFGYESRDLELMRNAHFSLGNPESKGPFIIAFKQQKPILVNDIDEIAPSLSRRSYEFARNLGTKSFICCPIVYEGESFGILAVDNIKTKRPLLQSDINLLMGIAPEIAISIHNARLIESREEQFKSTLEVLAKSIDARDFLTAGHSEKVTEYAVGISKELGLPDDYREMIRVASLLHDYGKIGISDAILKKPGSLTREEYEEIKTHAEKTRQILLKINFQGIYREVPDIAGAHHEKVDGSGYPSGLRGDEIPMGAKIIAVADFFEAVTAKRHYREPMPVDVALSMLEEKRDIHYDGSVIDAFLRYYHGNGYIDSNGLKRF